MTGPDPSLLAAAAAWIAEDPDPSTRRELEELRDRALRDPAAAEALAARFADPLRFGTAGIRGALGAGPGRMNRLLVRRVAGGVARWVLGTSGTAPRVVVGRDARNGSAAFLIDLAEVLAEAGVEVVALPEPVPTPVLAFAVVRLAADAGLMVTASHNPPADNGVKVFGRDGAQIVAPVDEQIAAAMATAPDAGHPRRSAEREAGGTTPSPAAAPIVEAYLSAVAGVVGPGPGTVPIRVAYTALHGVAASVTVRAFADLPFAELVVEPSEVVPDPAFGGLVSPNPESADAWRKVLAMAAACDAHLALAHDPDGDRLGVAVPAPGGGSGADPGGWQRLTGDEIGALLADHLLSRPAPPRDDRQALVVATVVSSRLVRRIAEAAGAEYVDTLTGFKWIARAGLDRPHRRWVLGYEQALGFSVSDAVRDKDAVSAALVVSELVAQLAARGETVWDRLDAIAGRHGRHVTGSRLLEVPTRRALGAVMADVRARGPRWWEALAPGATVTDYLDPDRTGLPPSDLLVATWADGTRVAVRPSGTEPVIKLYGETVGAPGGADEGLAARARELLDAGAGALRGCWGGLVGDK